MIADDRARPFEPERRNLCKNFTLVRNARAKHVVEGRDAIAGDDQETIAELENVADFSPSIRCAIREPGLENGRGERQETIL